MTKKMDNLPFFERSSTVDLVLRMLFAVLKQFELLVLIVFVAAFVKELASV